MNPKGQHGEVMSDPVQIAVAGASVALFGPGVRELGEFIADKIRYQRWKSAVKTLERAKEFAEPYGGLKKVPPLKFFVPFMENCSLEEEDEELVDMWAHLLVSASNDFESGHLLFMRILKEITGVEVRLIRKIAQISKDEDYLTLLDIFNEWEMFSASASPLRNIDFSSWGEVKTCVLEKLQSPGALVEHLVHGKIGGDVRDMSSLKMGDTHFAVQDYEPAELLKSLGLVVENRQRLILPDSGYEAEAKAFCFRPIGSKMLVVCSGVNIREIDKRHTEKIMEVIRKKTE